MKKIFLLALAALSVPQSWAVLTHEQIPIPENAVPATYVKDFNNEINHLGGIGNHYDVGCFYGGPSLLGKKVVGVKVNGIATKGTSNVRIWSTVSWNISMEDSIFRPDTRDIPVKLEADGSASTGFKNPVTIPRTGIFFGVGIDNDPTVPGATKFPLAAYENSGPDRKFTFFFHPSYQPYFYDYSKWDCAGVTIYLEDGAAVSSKAVPTMVEGLLVTTTGTGCEAPIWYQNWSGDSIHDFECRYTLDGKIYNQAVTVDPPTSHYLLQHHNFNLSLPALDKAGSYTVPVCITKVNGAANPAANTSIDITYNVLAGNITHRPLMEEYSGTGCKWCARGMVAMNELEKAFPDFIGAAFHYYNSDDPMYLSEVPNEFKQFPTCQIDRVSGEIDPFFGTSDNKSLGIKDDYQKMMDMPAPANIGLEAAFNADSTEITAKATVNFGFVDGGYSVYYLVTADHMVGDDDDEEWEQGNAYLGGNETDPLLSQLCKGTYDMRTFNHVVVDCSEAKKTANTTHWEQKDLVAGQDYTARHTFKLADCSFKEKDALDYLDKNHVNVIAFIVDDKGQVRNAVKVKVGEKKDVAVPGILEEGSDNVNAIYYDLQGRRIANPAEGVYIKVEGSKATKVIK